MCDVKQSYKSNKLTYKEILYSRGGTRINKTTNMFIPGGLLMGMGIGLAVGEVAAGMFIGLGAGFILTTLANFFINR